MRWKRAPKRVFDATLGNCVVIGPPRSNYGIALFGVIGVAFLVGYVLDPRAWHATPGQLLVIGPASIGMIAFPFLQARTKRLWVGERGFRVKTFRKAPIEAFWRDTGPAEIVLKSVLMPIRRNGVWGMWSDNDFEGGSHHLRELLNTARVQAVGSEPIPGAPWTTTDQTTPVPVPAPGRKTVRDFEVERDVTHVVEEWAADNRFTFVGTAADETRTYVSNELAYPSAATRPTGNLSAPRFVSIRQTGREVHLEAWWIRNGYFRFVTRGRIPPEAPVEAGGWVGRLLTVSLRKPVDDLLGRLGQPPLGAHPLELPQGTKPAGMRRRSAAFLIDVCLYLVLIDALAWVGSSIRGSRSYSTPEYVAIMWLWFFLVILYVPVLWRWLGGLPAQSLLGMRLIRSHDGRRLDGWACLGRYVVWLACVLTLVPAVITAILALRDPYRRTWPDRAVGSVVVRSE